MSGLTANLLQLIADAGVWTLYALGVCAAGSVLLVAWFFWATVREERRERRACDLEMRDRVGRYRDPPAEILQFPTTGRARRVEPHVAEASSMRSASVADQIRRAVRDSDREPRTVPVQKTGLWHGLEIELQKRDQEIVRLEGLLARHGIEARS